MKQPKAKTGRPVTKAPSNEKVTLGIRTTPALKDRLMFEADNNDRSLSQEAEMRLEQSFQTQGLLKDVLSLAYGREVAGLLIAMGAAMQSTAAIASLLHSYGTDRRSWLSDPYVYDQVVQAVSLILEAFRPDGNATAPQDLIALHRTLAWGKKRGRAEEIVRDTGANVAKSTLEVICAPSAPSDDPRGVGDAVRELLGPLLTSTSHSRDFADIRARAEALLKERDAS